MASGFKLLSGLGSRRLPPRLASCPYISCDSLLLIQVLLEACEDPPDLLELHGGGESSRRIDLLGAGFGFVHHACYLLSAKMLVYFL